MENQESALRSVESTPIRRRWLMAIGAALIALSLGVAVPAYAGTFTRKVTPGGCSQTDFSGRTATSGYGNTQHGAIVCATDVQVRIQLFRNGVTGPTQISGGYTVETTLAGPGTLTGVHRLCVRVAGTPSYSCDFANQTIA